MTSLKNISTVIDSNFSRLEHLLHFSYKVRKCDRFRFAKQRHLTAWPQSKAFINHMQFERCFRGTVCLTALTFPLLGLFRLRVQGFELLKYCGGSCFVVVDPHACDTVQWLPGHPASVRAHPDSDAANNRAGENAQNTTSAQWLGKLMLERCKSTLWLTNVRPS